VQRFSSSHGVPSAMEDRSTHLLRIAHACIMAVVSGCTYDGFSTYTGAAAHVSVFVQGLPSSQVFH